VALGSGSVRIEPRAVVLQLQHDVLTLLGDRHRHVGRIGVLDGVHDALACDVEHEQGDRRRQIDVLHVPMEPDVRIAPDLVRERLERVREAFGAEGRTVQVPDQRTDPIRRLLLRLTDLVQLLTHVIDIAPVQELSSDIDLEGKAEQDLGEVVMEIPGDLQSLVCPLLGHGVRELAEDLLTLGKFDVSFLECLGPEEHLPRED